ncbi:MAG: putative ABC transporter permease [Massiliimalia sp.]|jgi:uncharacterized membrane protein
MVFKMATVFLWFLIYSFLGWFYESTLCSITGKKLVNRGFLSGPICPVYGFGALIVIFSLQDIVDESILSLFLSSAVLTTVLEYLTSWGMEKLFHARWWDYSQRKFNLNGRVCLEGALVFALLSVLLLKGIHPFVSGQVARIPDIWLYVVSGVLFCIFIADVVSTVRSILLLNHKLEEIQAVIDQEREKSRQRLAELRENLAEKKTELEESVRESWQERADEWQTSVQQRRQRLAERLENSEFYTEHIRELLSQRKFNERRLLKAFPNLKSSRSNEALEQLKEKLRTYRRP